MLDCGLIAFCRVGVLKMTHRAELGGQLSLSVSLSPSHSLSLGTLAGLDNRALRWPPCDKSHRLAFESRSSTSDMIASTPNLLVFSTVRNAATLRFDGAMRPAEARAPGVAPLMLIPLAMTARKVARS